MNYVLNSQTEVAAANYPQMRLFTVARMAGNEPRRLVTGQWAVCTPQAVADPNAGWGGFTAVGYFFGRDLQQAVHVPIGLIHDSWGGTMAESWISAEPLGTIPDFLPNMAVFHRTALAEKGGQSFDQVMETWYARHDPGSAPGSSWAAPALDTSHWKTMTLPQVWKSALVPELAHFDGTVWFRRTFDLAAAWAGKDLALHLGQISERDMTFVNGVKVGQLNQWWQQRDYVIPTALLKSGQNVLAVRALSTGLGNSGLIGPAEKMGLQPSNDTSAVPLSLAGPWSYQLGAPLPADDPPYMPIDGDSGQPTALYNGMIAPLLPFGIKGALWYQGEYNADRGKQYRTLLPMLIKDWRGRWGLGNFPFLIVQLPNFGRTPDQPAQSNWAELREAQLLTAATVPDTGLAVTIDLGEPDNIHPRAKQEVGRRLALAAEALVYGQKIEASGPLYQSMTVEGSAIRLHFTHLGGGLVAKGSDKLTGFAIAGADGKFAWADARIDGPTVVVSSPSVTAPTAVRYAWADSPICNLYNGAGLPASPFRTDTDPK